MDSEATVAIAAKAGETMAKVIEKTRTRLTG